MATVRLKVVERDEEKLIARVLECDVDSEELSPGQRIKLGLTDTAEECARMAIETEESQARLVAATEAAHEAEMALIETKAMRKIAEGYAAAGFGPEEALGMAATYLAHEMAGKSLDLEGVCHARPEPRRALPLSLVKRAG